MSTTNTMDVKIVGGRYNVRPKDVQDRGSSSAVQIYPGDPVKVSGNYVVPVATAEPKITAPLLGIAKSTSTETASADGTVEVFEIIPGETVLRCKANTPANIDTAAKLLAVKNHSVLFDLSSSVYTIDENATSDPNVNGLDIIDGDITKGTLDVVVRAYACQYHSAT